MNSVLNTFVPIRVFDKVSNSSEIRLLHQAMAVILAKRVTLVSHSQLTVQCGFFDFIIDEKSIFSSHFFLISQRLKLHFSFFTHFFSLSTIFSVFFPFGKLSILFSNEFSLIYSLPLYLPCAICPKIGSVIVSERCDVSNGKLLEKTMLIQFLITTKAKSIPVQRLYTGADVDAINCK